MISILVLIYILGIVSYYIMALLFMRKQYDCITRGEFASIIFYGFMTSWLGVLFELISVFTSDDWADEIVIEFHKD